MKSKFPVFDPFKKKAEEKKAIEAERAKMALEELKKQINTDYINSILSGYEPKRTTEAQSIQKLYDEAIKKVFVPSLHDLIDKGLHVNAPDNMNKFALDPKSIKELDDAEKRSKHGSEADFVWVTADKRHILVSEMEINHLFNTTRMVYNQMVPQEYRIVAPNPPKFCIQNQDNLRAFKILMYHCGIRLTKFTDEQLNSLLYIRTTINKLNFL